MLPIVIGLYIGVGSLIGYGLNRLRQRDTTTATATETATRNVILSEIPMWNDYFINNDEDLLKLKPRDRNSADFTVNAAINNKVSIIQCDITCLAIDGIVSVNNPDLLSTGGVSSEIEKAGGPGLVKEVEALNGCKCGEAKTTSGHNLPAKYVIHTVGPPKANPKHLERCYQSCLEQMESNQMKSLAFCCISTGMHGYRNDEEVHVALKTVRNWLEDLNAKQKLNEIDRIVFCLSSELDKCLYESWMSVYFPCLYENVDGSEAFLKEKDESK